MPLTTGTRLGHYEVIAVLGAGSMGEVYRARDTKLSREVAIKVLPDTGAADPERLARFAREAQLVGPSPTLSRSIRASRLMVSSWRFRRWWTYSRRSPVIANWPSLLTKN